MGPGSAQLGSQGAQAADTLRPRIDKHKHMFPELTKLSVARVQKQGRKVQSQRRT